MHKDNNRKMFDDRINTLPGVSVIVPCCNDSERLQTCLNALENQSYSKNHYEIIVVDNGSDDNLGELFEQSDHIIVREGQPGSYAARNKGLSIAKGEIIAFTDSDCIPESDWIEKGVERILKEPECGLVAGRINMFFRDSDKPTAVELYDSITSLPQKYFVEVHKFGATANIFTCRSVIEHIGNFNDYLKSGGDYEWGRRVCSFGYKIIYADDVCVSHPARYSFRQLYNKHIRVIGGQYDRGVRGKNSVASFLKFSVKGLLPPFMAINEFFKEDRFKGLSRKCKIIFVFCFVRIVWISEKIRLVFAGTSRQVLD